MLQSPAAKALLRTGLVEPLLADDPTHQALCLRLSWLLAEPGSTQRVWDEMVDVRRIADHHVTSLRGVRLCVSALTATKTSRRRGEDSVYPGIGYWLLAEREVCNQRHVATCLGQCPVGGATTKTLLQPYMGSVDEVSNALYTVLKDNTSGYVRRKVDTSAAWRARAAERDHPAQHPLVIIYVIDPALLPLTESLKQQLDNVPFPVQIEHLT